MLHVYRCCRLEFRQHRFTTRDSDMHVEIRADESRRANSNEDRIRAIGQVLKNCRGTFPAPHGTARSVQSTECRLVFDLCVSYGSKRRTPPKSLCVPTLATPLGKLVEWQVPVVKLLHLHYPFQLDVCHIFRLNRFRTCICLDT